MASLAERALEDAPKRPTKGHVEALMKADAAAKRIAREREQRAADRLARIAREKAEREAASQLERAAAAMRKVAGR